VIRVSTKSIKSCTHNFLILKLAEMTVKMEHKNKRQHTEPKKQTEDKSAQYVFIECPNCKDGRYKCYSKGGYTDVGPLACVEPRCKFCDGNTRLIMCYGCDHVTRYTEDSFDVKRCDGCKLILSECTNHKWKWNLVGEILTCNVCGKSGKPSPVWEPQCNEYEHVWMIDAAAGDIRCRTCKKQGQVQ
jgi:hypothetical protein